MDAFRTLVHVPSAEWRLLFEHMQNFVPRFQVQAPNHPGLQAGPLPLW
jgi:hypothetical protein